MTRMPRVTQLFAPVPRELPEELNEVLLEAGALRIERIVSRGHRSPPGAWYDQEKAEFVALLRGAAGLRFEGCEEVLVLGPGDCIDIPAHVRHQVAWTDVAQDTVWLAVHYLPGGTPAG